MERMEIYKKMHKDEHFKSWPIRAFKALEDPATARVLLIEFYEQNPEAPCVALFLVLVEHLFLTGFMKEEEFERVMMSFIKTTEELRKGEYKK
jgi:hypothetical protein